MLIFYPQAIHKLFEVNKESVVYVAGFALGFYTVTKHFVKLGMWRHMEGDIIFSILYLILYILVYEKNILKCATLIHFSDITNFISK